MSDDDARREVEPLDYSPSSGSRDRDFSSSAPDTDVPTEIDGRSGAQTDFVPSNGHFDAPEDVDEPILRDGEEVSYDEWLSKLHHGHRSSEYTGGDRARTGVLHDIRVLASVFDLTKAQQSRAIHIIRITDDLNETEKGEAAALAAVSLATNEDDRWIQREDTDETPSWQAVCGAFNVSTKSLNHARETLRESL